MEQNIHALIESMRLLEERVNTLQAENDSLQRFQQQQQPTTSSRSADYFRIPDPIRVIPGFDGNKKQLIGWLTTVKKTLDLFKNNVAPEIFSVYEQTVINKIEGKARDTICVNGNPTTFDEVADILQNVYGDRNNIATYQTQLWNLKQNESLSLHYRKTKEILINMKSVARQNTVYASHWEAINLFLEQECLAAFINGLSKTYFGYAQTAQPEDLESAYAFLCRFQNAERTKSNTNNGFEKHPSVDKNVKRDNKFSQPKHLENRPFNNMKPSSDRTKIVPMDVDQSLRSNMRNKIFSHTAEEDDGKTISEESDSDEETDNEEDVNFQITANLNPPS